MSDLLLLAMLFGAGVLVLVAEIFIPSHGVLSLVGLGFLFAGIWQTFSTMGRQAGVVSVLACLVFIPTFAYVAVKYWRNTPIGKIFAPPNPQLSDADSTVRVEQLRGLVGKSGRAVSPLRPVGICQIDGRRITCVAQFGMIAQGDEVEGVGVSGTSLTVVARTKDA